VLKGAARLTKRRIPRLTRRRFLTLVGGTVAAGIGCAGYALRIEPHWVQVVRRELVIEGLGDSLVGKSLVQISDLHVGPIVDEDYISGAMQQVSSLHADIVVITGDLMTCRDTEQITAAMRVLGHLKPARLATVAILGNHDYGSGWSQTHVADALTTQLRRRGIIVLRNDVHHVQGLRLVGLDDLWSPRFAPRRVLAAVDRDEPAIVLCHNPDAADLPVWSGYRGWILAGHTHGGQCKPPFFNPPALPVKNKRYSAGEIDLHDGRRLYINRGLGYLRRVRFNARPEITVFTLRRAQTGNV
jgi:predicted MPP superfamily phosphohydrolase